MCLISMCISNIFLFVLIPVTDLENPFNGGGGGVPIICGHHRPLMECSVGLEGL